jgi:hypothetical protein
LPAIGTSAFGNESVIGLSRDPTPAAVKRTLTLSFGIRITTAFHQSLIPNP